MNALSIVGHTSCHNRTAVVSLRCHDMDEAELAYRLAEQFQIATRVGLHCAPNAHQTLKTYPKGTIRFSFGYRYPIANILPHVGQKSLSSGWKFRQSLVSNIRST